MPELLEEDLWWCVAGLPDSVSELLHDKTKPRFCAGGFIRSRIAGEIVNDIDLFASTAADAKDMAKYLVQEGEQIYESKNAFSVDVGNRSVQLIHRWTFSDPADCIQSFDYTIARAAIWWDGLNWKSLCDERFYPDLAAGRLVYCCPTRNEDAGGSILRALKFAGRGYRIPPSELGKVIARLMSAVDMHKVEQFSEGNPEARLATVLTGLLYEVDPSVADRVQRREKRR